ncbi:ceramidase [Lasiosphaeria miniovina]|uniref:Ceramidase n=1 Tax=Lasiosphaeria miniovina TaxID=1954250 RepID=A0AA40AWE7_9PEZI|nr:ceramidase [Lasiosphaeria miniovina]KAK0723218.1 ceramidase [Lasiosphaeria miniovina]
MAVSLVVLGITSFAFHASLLQPAQFADDMSMLITAGALLQGVYCAAGGGVQRPPRQRAAISAAVYAVVAAMAAAYVQSGKIIVHLAMFTAMVHAVWPRTVYLIFRRADGSAAERNRLFRNFGVAIAWLLVGFVLWNVDLELCHGLRGWRAVVGLPWAWLLELHGWWHIMTGIGAAMYMDLIRELE